MADLRTSPVQVSIGGLEHALTSIAVASPLIHVFDAPTTFLGALWLPYRRDRRQLEEAVAAAGPVKAVFAHADVVRTYVLLASVTICALRYLKAAKDAFLSHAATMLNGSRLHSRCVCWTGGYEGDCSPPPMLHCDEARIAAHSSRKCVHMRE